jgi:hypothetical protein
MSKVHEILAVESQLKGQAETARKDLKNTLEKKRHHFEEKRVTFQPNTEGAAPVVESQSDIQTSVSEELKWIQSIWSKALDVAYQVAESNTKARADVVLDDGTILLKQMPTTALLELEKRAGEMQELITAIPTLDPAKGFTPDPDRLVGTFKAREVRKARTKKQIVPLVLFAATKEHPAQVKEISEDVVVGTIVEQEWSSLVTPKTKGEMLERVEELRRAVKTARMRANDNDVDVKSMQKIGDAVFGYVFGHG